MDALLLLEADVATQVQGQLLTAGGAPLTVTRWQPRQAQPPCLWNWLPQGAPFEQRDQVRWRDTLPIEVRIGIQHTEVDQEMADLEVLADVARDVIDTALANPTNANQYLGGAATWAKRTSMRTAVWDISGVQLLGLALVVQVQMDRQIRSS